MSSVYGIVLIILLIIYKYVIVKIVFINNNIFKYYITYLLLKYMM